MIAGETAVPSRAEYFKKYNKRSPVRSVRLPEDLLQKINDVVIQQGSSFNRVVIQRLEKSFENDSNREHVIQHGDDVVIQMKKHLIFMMNFFQKNADVLRPRVNEEERRVFREIAKVLVEGEK